MRILCVGDVVGDLGVDFLNKKLFDIKKSNNIDFIIVNGENSSPYNGITPDSAEAIFNSGADIITTGNHVFRRKEIYDYLENNERIIRPANYPKNVYGKYITYIDNITYQICVINMMGTVYMNDLDNPFHIIDEILKEVDTKNIIIDFHAEATSEKVAFANYVDGRVSAVFGTHTHVQTSDERLLPKGTAFITDIGMVGVIDSALGIDLEPVIKKFITKMPTKFKPAVGACVLGGIILDINEKTGKVNTIKRISVNNTKENSY